MEAADFTRWGLSEHTPSLLQALDWQMEDGGKTMVEVK